jgi:hypothetical protein
VITRSFSSFALADSFGVNLVVEALSFSGCNGVTEHLELMVSIPAKK